MIHIEIGDAGRLCGAVLAVALPSLVTAEEVVPVQAQEQASGVGSLPLHTRIDQVVGRGNVASVAGRAGETELVRRLHLDLAGRIPTAVEVRAYLASTEADKWNRLVDTLLGSREHARHLATTFDHWLMERRKDAHVPSAEWRKYLTDCFAANKPFDQLAREILSADGTAERGGRAAARFYLDRIGEPHLITRDVGRLFFGKDLQCAQCHDHPNVTDYLQRDYYGLFAFYSRTSWFHPDTKKPSLLSEKAAGEASYTSVFTAVKGTARPRLPGGGEFEEPVFKVGEEYRVKPNPKDKKVRPVPHYSRRGRLAKLATDGKNEAFNRNIANRLWGHMMGRALIEPADMAHAGNPATHPELLGLLTREIVAMKFDVRAYLREVALTETYARSFEMPADLAERGESVRSRLRELEAEAARLREVANSAAAEFREGRKAWEAARKALAAVVNKGEPVRKGLAATAAAKKKAEEPLLKVRAQLEARAAVLEALEAADGKNAEVVKVLPEDKELAAAAAKFKARSDTLRAEVAKLQAEASAKEKGVEEAERKFVAARTAADEHEKLVAGEGAKAAAAEEGLERGQAHYQSAQAAAVRAERRTEGARKLIAYAEAARELEVLGTTANQLGSALEGHEKRAEVELKFAEDLKVAAERAAAASQAKPEDAEIAEALKVLQKRSESAQSQASVADVELRKHRGAWIEAAEKARLLALSQSDRLDALTKHWESSIAVRASTALTPEQLCASTLRATGEWEHTVAAVEVEFEKKLAEAARKAAAPAKKEGEKKEEKKAPEPPQLTEGDRARYLEEQRAKRLKPARDKFIRLFGGQAGSPQTEFFATADQALFYEHDGLVRSWLRPKGGNLTARLGKIEDSAQLAEELYLSTVTRLPDEGEKTKVRDYLASRGKERANAIQELTWALLSSVEFRFNH